MRYGIAMGVVVVVAALCAAVWLVDNRDATVHTLDTWIEAANQRARRKLSAHAGETVQAIIHQEQALAAQIDTFYYTCAAVLHLVDAVWSSYMADIMTLAAIVLNIM